MGECNFRQDMPVHGEAHRLSRKHPHQGNVAPSELASDRCMPQMYFAIFAPPGG